MTSGTFGVEWSAALRRGSPGELDGWLQVAQALCDEADAIALRDFRTARPVEWAESGRLVTETDLEIERLFRTTVRDRFPTHGFVGEEYGTEGGDRSVRWYVDPIDGTEDFVGGIPLFAILVGVEREDELQVGVMSIPALGQRLYARRGAGAWCNGRRIHVSATTNLDDAQLLYYAFNEMNDSPYGGAFRSLLRIVRRDRALGSVWADALVADGSADVAIELDLDPWDVAASVVIVEEAGGRVTDLRGIRSIHGGDVLVSNGLLHDVVLAQLTSNEDGDGSG
jgi:histidinol-phosphatase